MNFFNKDCVGQKIVLSSLPLFCYIFNVLEIETF